MNVTQDNPPYLLKLRNIRKSFGQLEVLKGIDLDVKHGEVVAIIGASGSGKSTFLRSINAIATADKGTMDFEGKHFNFDPKSEFRPDERQLQALRSRIGMVFQSYNLWPHKTVLQNVIHAPVRVLGQSQAEATEAADVLLDRIGLYDKRNSSPQRLSGGQQQRVAIARALAMKPQLMLFDEVTSALDPELVQEVLKLIAILANDGMTMLLVTHEMSFARNVSSRVLFFDQGVIGEEGEPSKVLRNPESPRLRQFLHSILHDDLTVGDQDPMGLIP
jgi:polar amino acid transport system ATP-binding protein